MGFFVAGTFIPWYGFCIAIGVICAFLLGYFLCKHAHVSYDNFILIGAYLFAFGFTGAKILYIIVSWKEINFSYAFQSFKNFNEFIGAGFVFYGGLIGGALGLLFIKKVHHIELKTYISILPPCLSLAHAFGRIGCSLAGCCYGCETTCSFCFEYTKSLAAPNGVKLFPVQGIESASLFLLTIVLVILFIKNTECKTFVVYAAVYSVIRFVLEFFRGDAGRGFAWIFSTSQIISIIVFTCAAAYEIKANVFIKARPQEK